MKLQYFHNIGPAVTGQRATDKDTTTFANTDECQSHDQTRAPSPRTASTATTTTTTT